MAERAAAGRGARGRGRRRGGAAATVLLILLSPSFLPRLSARRAPLPRAPAGAQRACAQPPPGNCKQAHYCKYSVFLSDSCSALLTIHFVTET